MSQRHDEAFRSIRREHDDAVVALKRGKAAVKRGARGVASFDPSRLDAAIATAGDAYALLLIATAEAYLREYLQTPIGKEASLSGLIDRTAKQVKIASGLKSVSAESQGEMHDLRVQRNSYAHLTSLLRERGR